MNTKFICYLACTLHLLRLEANPLPHLAVYTYREIVSGVAQRVSCTFTHYFLERICLMAFGDSLMIRLETYWETKNKGTYLAINN